MTRFLIDKYRSIRNILVCAANLAADNGSVVTVAHLLHRVRRKIQKMGR